MLKIREHTSRHTGPDGKQCVQCIHVTLAVHRSPLVTAGGVWPNTVCVYTDIFYIHFLASSYLKYIYIVY